MNLKKVANIISNTTQQKHNNKPTTGIYINSSSPGQNAHRFTDTIFRCIFLNEKFGISIKISLKFVPKSPIDD